MTSWGASSKTLNLPLAREHHEAEGINCEPKSYAQRDRGFIADRVCQIILTRLREHDTRRG